ncbi:forkhead box Q2 [Takifugu flavidus]|uniref:Hepatocyte nuclear factor 3-gamma n=1 Tax=Takifugu flavidus TaxID=433684 RepID=A0A5C6MW84_9TELE|nr:forkhead box Q2 [Takifugu flavidus]TWW57770.1 Hepatocyte nuclear factor 3-gamma [Takifugu flavidus]
MSVSDPNAEMTKEDTNSRTIGRERLGLSFTIDYLLFNKGVKGSKEEATGSRTAEQTVNSVLNHQNPKSKEVEIHSEKQETWLQRSGNGARKGEGEEGDEDQAEKKGEDLTTTMSTCSSLEKSADKPNQSYIALISKAILASDQKKLLLCDIYQWIMDHYPYFKSKDKNWRNSVRHNLSLNDCFIKAGRSDNGKGHFWAIHPSNYQDFSNGDYHCRRARRRVRRAGGQLTLTPLSSPYHTTLPRPNRAACWCCPQVQTLPLSCMAPGLYWSPWSNMHPSVGLQSFLHTSAP